jgi:hypothetical protein
MGRPRSTPDKRASDARKDMAKVRRRLKVDLTKDRKLAVGEEQQVGTIVLVLKLASYSNLQIARIVGVSKGQVKTFLDTPAAQEMLVELRTKISEAALELLHGYMIEAVQSIATVMRHSQDDKMILQAAAEILDRGGVPKASRQERLTENTENIQISDDGLVDRLREASPEVQERAAALVEELEQLTLLAATEEAEDGQT